MASLRQPDKAYWDAYYEGRSLPAHIQRDPVTGAPYTLHPDGYRLYLAPEGNWVPGSRPGTLRNTNIPTDTTGIFRMSPRWDSRTGRWVTPIDWSNIAAIGAGTGIGAGAASAFAGGAPAVAGAPAATVGPTAGPITSASMAAAMPGSMVAAPTIAGAGGAAGTAATAAGTGSAANVLKKIGGAATGSNGMDFSEMLKLALLQGGLGTLSSLLGKDEPQRQSFRGTSADPVNMLTEAQNSIRGFKEPLMTRLRTPVTIPGTSAPPNAFGIRGSVPAVQANRGDFLERARTLTDFATTIGRR